MMPWDSEKPHSVINSLQDLRAHQPQPETLHTRRYDWLLEVASAHPAPSEPCMTSGLRKAPWLCVEPQAQAMLLVLSRR